MMSKSARASSSRSGAANGGDLNMAALVIGGPFLVRNGKAGLFAPNHSGNWISLGFAKQPTERRKRSLRLSFPQFC